MNTTKVTLCLIVIIISSFWVVGNAKTPMLCNVHHSSRIALKGDLQTSSTRSLGKSQVIEAFWDGKNLDVSSFCYLGNISIVIIDYSGDIIYQNEILFLNKSKFVFEIKDLHEDKYVLKFIDDCGRSLSGELLNLFAK